MILQSTYIEPRVSPDFMDRVVAARTSTLVTAMAAFWLVITPFTYFGYSEESSAWNAWLIGAAMLLLCGLRLLRPTISSWASWINAALGFWIFVSPWVFGYVGYNSRTVSSTGVGATVIAFSIFSASFTRHMSPQDQHHHPHEVRADGTPIPE